MKIAGSKYIVPFFDNKRWNPYGYIIVEDENNKQHKRYYELDKKDTFIFNKVKYKLINNGTLYSPKLKLVLYDEWLKEHTPF